VQVSRSELAGPASDDDHVTDPKAQAPGTNWAGNYAYRAKTLHRPTTVEELQDIVARSLSVRVLGSRHSFNDIADAEELISLEALTADKSVPANMIVNHDQGTVTVGGGVKYGELVETLIDNRLALHTLASLPHISVAGAVATATHGSGVTNGNLATAVAALQLVTSSGEILEVSRGEPGFDGIVVGLGALGVVIRLTLDVQPLFEVRQRVFEGLSWKALYEHLDEILSSGYSVSIFTRWAETCDQVWVKTRTDAPEKVIDDFFGAVPATADRHPVPGLDPIACTPQMGRPGLWSDRLPHFRTGFTPSSGSELQSEYLVPRPHAVEAIEAVRVLAKSIRPILQVCELRTVQADQLWMSMSYGVDTVGIHFTWAPAPDRVGKVLIEIEDALAPFHARPHWGKLFHSSAAAIVPLYEKHSDFVRLVERLDPRGAFCNPWLNDRVVGRN
jgi:alditol oxidase